MIRSILLLLLLSPPGDGAHPGIPRTAAMAQREAATGVAPEPGPTAPDGVTASADVADLRADLTRMMRSPRWRNDRWGVMVVSLERGDTLFAHEPDDLLAPASNLKLYTTAAALYYLGPEFRFATYVLTDGSIAGGVLTGDLIMYGTGDPTMSDRFFRSKTEVWELLADTLAALGVREIRGDIVGDASYFAGLPTGVGWQESYMNASYAAPASALSFNDNVTTLHIRPAAQVGWRPSIRLIPGGDGIAIVNQATTVAGGRSWIDVNRAAYTGPIVVRGRITPGHAGVWRAVPVADPARYSAAMMREVLSGRGIAVAGQVRSVHLTDESPLSGRSVFAPAFDGRPPLHVLAVHRSPRLLDILDVINKKSHNLYAEQVLRTVGRVAVGEGTANGGARAIRHMVQRETAADSFSVSIFDGSGLSVLNRASARGLVQLLAYMAESPMWDDYWATLPEAGDAQGLRRMYGTRAASNLRAKTGTIDRVSALSGYVRTADGERLAFSIISNNVPSTWRAKRVEDAIGARLAAFRRSTELTTRPAPLSADRARVPSPESAAGRTHVIRRGDTLDGIAKRYGTTVARLRAANPGVDPRRLIPGRLIRIR